MCFWVFSNSHIDFGRPMQDNPIMALAEAVLATFIPLEL
jgi:hypothetical protein